VIAALAASTLVASLLSDLMGPEFEEIPRDLFWVGIRWIRPYTGPLHQPSQDFDYRKLDQSFHLVPVEVPRPYADILSLSHIDVKRTIMFQALNRLTGWQDVQWEMSEHQVMSTRRAPAPLKSREHIFKPLLLTRGGRPLAVRKTLSGPLEFERPSGEDMLLSGLGELKMDVEFYIVKTRPWPPVITIDLDYNDGPWTASGFETALFDTRLRYSLHTNEAPLIFVMRDVDERIKVPTTLIYSVGRPEVP